MVGRVEGNLWQTWTESKSGEQDTSWGECVEESGRGDGR